MLETVFSILLVALIVAVGIALVFRLYQSFNNDRWSAVLAAILTVVAAVSVLYLLPLNRSDDDVPSQPWGSSAIRPQRRDAVDNRPSTRSTQEPSKRSTDDNSPEYKYTYYYPRSGSDDRPSTRSTQEPSKRSADDNGPEYKYTYYYPRSGSDERSPRQVARESPQAEQAEQAEPEYPQQDPRLIGVLFATNRVIDTGIDHSEQNAIGSNQVTYKRSSVLRFGKAVVRVPENHRIGEVERPSSDLAIIGHVVWHTPENLKHHFLLKGVKLMTRPEAIQRFQDTQEHGVLIFVHGFNTSFDDAVYKTAQIAFDTHFQGLPVAFSWPSMASLTQYDYDQNSAQYSEDAFTALLDLIHNDGEVTKIYIVAHSMGNQIVLNALAHAQNAGYEIAMDEIIMAAPDVDRDVFNNLIERVKNVTKGLTLYASSADKALVLSRMKAGGVPRAGDVPAEGPILVSGMDSIDVTALGDDLFSLNHSLYSSNRVLIDDIGRLLIAGTRPPHARTPELLRVPETPPTKYWKYPY
jgi:esterase/lipase superfamily enzyme